MDKKELFKSVLLTFFTGMALVIVPEMSSLTIESLKEGAWVGLLFTAVRTGVKMLLELFLVKHGTE